MAARSAASDVSLRVRIRADGPSRPTLLEFSEFLYDFNLAFEIGRLALDPEYRSFKFTRAVNYRNARPLAEEDRLQIESIRLQSSIDFALATSGVLAGLWVLVQIVDRVANFALNRRKLVAEIEKLERENAQAHAESDDVGFLLTRESFDGRLSDRGALSAFDRAISRLDHSHLRITRVTITVVTDESETDIDLDQASQ